MNRMERWKRKRVSRAQKFVNPKARKLALFLKAERKIELTVWPSKYVLNMTSQGSGAHSSCLFLPSQLSVERNEWQPEGDGATVGGFENAFLE
jgi:hypothetical protein